MNKFEKLHFNLVYLNSAKAFEEFMAVYTFRGGKYKFESFQDIQNFYYVDKNGNKDEAKSLLGVRDSYGCQVDNTEYQSLVDKKNILIDKRISKEEFMRMIRE